MGIKDGSLSVVRTAQELIEIHGANPSLVLLKLDFRNAFNEMDR